MIPAKLLEMVFKAFFNHPKVKALFKYKDEPNELDVQVLDLEKKCTDIGFKVTSMQDILKGLGEDQHPPVIDLDEWEDVKNTIKKIKNKKAYKSLNAK